MDIKIGATYSTSNPKIPTIRVICELSREVDKKGDLVGPCRGYMAQVCDGKYHAPLRLDAYGMFEDVYGGLEKMVEPPLQKYK